MKTSKNIAIAFFLFLGTFLRAGGESAPLGSIGTKAIYTLETAESLRPTTVQRLEIALGPIEMTSMGDCQWLQLAATKAGGERFRVSILARSYPKNSLPSDGTNIVRYLLQEGNAQPKEFVHRVTGASVFPTTGAWEFLWPKPEAGGFQNGIESPRILWLGHAYVLESASRDESIAPPKPMRIELMPDALVGVPSNTRTRDDRRRYDGSDYELVRLTRDDYALMIASGMNCFRVDAEQAKWLADEPVFIWGVGGAEVPFPECLYRSTWIGPALFLDEPAVHTRDEIVRPKLAKDPALRKSVNPQVVLGEFTNYFHHTIADGTPWNLIKGFRARPDVNLGTLNFPQRNLYTWETMIASAAWQLGAEINGGPAAIVFEPPGRVGARRTLPEMNMVYGCQIPADNAGHLANILIGFLRGAARATDKGWGMSIYGGVDLSDAPLWLTHSYDLGAKYFFFWDNYKHACVPFAECLALSRHLQAHIAGHPKRNLTALNRSAEVAILFPPGYDLGHVHTGRGNAWGLGELNLERINRFGISYREVMGNVFVEIERCLRLGVPFDLLWNLDGIKTTGYLEVVAVHENGRVEITSEGRRSERSGPRIPTRSDAPSPGLDVTLLENGERGAGRFTARAKVMERSSPVYYSTGADDHGIHHNARVLWELFGPEPEDYRALLEIGANPKTTWRQDGVEVEIDFHVERPGHYRLRAATTDLAGRSSVIWKKITVGD